MPSSDALIVVEDWISEHFFTTDARKESFQKLVLDRRKQWDGEDVPTTRIHRAGQQTRDDAGRVVLRGSRRSS